MTGYLYLEEFVLSRITQVADISDSQGDHQVHEEDDSDNLEGQHKNGGDPLTSS